MAKIWMVDERTGGPYYVRRWEIPLWRCKGWDINNDDIRDGRKHLVFQMRQEWALGGMFSYVIRFGVCFRAVH